MESTFASRGASESGVQRNGGKARDEHDLEIGIDFRRTARQFDAIHFRHDDIRQQKRKWFLLEPFIGAGTIVKVCHVITGLFQRFYEETAHIVIVFS
ncbi:hypothetical protein DK62_2204 [Brucella melitensis bv. 3 str. Ether]|nr:hypothetical protein DK62_2204 [Brucella melitensis bv. 3 str. Ether]